MVVPATFPEFTTRRVLTTSWLNGEKLSQSKADDVAQLVNLGVVCYLKQLLDTGFFHVCPAYLRVAGHMWHGALAHQAITIAAYCSRHAQGTRSLHEA